jgi:hypothetical protein
MCENEIGKTFNMHKIFCYENLKKRDYWEEPSTDVMTILKHILKHKKEGKDWIHPVPDREK